MQLKFKNKFTKKFNKKCCFKLNKNELKNNLN